MKATTAVSVILASSALLAFATPAAAMTVLASGEGWHVQQSGEATSSFGPFAIYADPGTRGGIILRVWPAGIAGGFMDATVEDMTGTVVTMSWTQTRTHGQANMAHWNQDYAGQFSFDLAAVTGTTVDGWRRTTYVNRGGQWNQRVTAWSRIRLASANIAAVVAALRGAGAALAGAGAARGATPGRVVRLTTRGSSITTTSPAPAGSQARRSTRTKAGDALSGTWTGTWSNSRGDKGTARQSVSVDWATGTASLTSYSRTSGGWKGNRTLTGKVVGSTIYFPDSEFAGRTYTNQSFRVSSAHTGTFSYSVSDPHRTPRHYSGTSTLKRQ